MNQPFPHHRLVARCVCPSHSVYYIIITIYIYKSYHENVHSSVVALVHLSIRVQLGLICIVIA